MDELQSWWEIPSIAHFCSLFRAAFSLPDFDIEELEEALLAAGTDEGSQFLEDLFCRLLQGCYGRDDIEPYNFEIYLKDILKQRWEVEEKKENPLDGREFKLLDVKKKVEVLHSLCDFRLDAVDVMDQLKGLEGENMRVDPLGKDGEGATYWYFYGSRLYKEDPEPEPVKEEKPDKKTKKKKKEEEKEKKNKKLKKKNAKKGKAKSQQLVSSSGRPIRNSGRMRLKLADEEEEESDEEIEKASRKKSVKLKSRSHSKSVYDDSEGEKDDEIVRKTPSRGRPRKSRSQSKSVVKKEEQNEDLATISSKLSQSETENQNSELCESKESEDPQLNVSTKFNPPSPTEHEDEKEDKNTDDMVYNNEPEQPKLDITEDRKENTKETEHEVNENKGIKEQDGFMEEDETIEPEPSESEKAEIKTEVKTEDRKPEINPRWHLICTTFEDWEQLAEKFKGSKLKCEKDLYRCITIDFLPAIPDIIEAREKERKKRMQEAIPRRLSSRIEYKRREQLEQERILADAKEEEDRQKQAEEEERRRLQEIERQEEERRTREERQKAREERAKRLEQREQRARLIAEGKEIPPELKYTASSYNSKYREDDDTRPELDEETVEEMTKVLEMVKAHKDAWPFMEPVDEEVAPGYHDVIKKPMDISLIERKLTNRVYKSTRRFIQDINLMLDNCRHFNGIESELGMMAQRLQRCLTKAVRIYMDKDDYDEDEDFRANKIIRAEMKKYRPKRAASSRAMDTLHRAMNSDDEMDDEDSDEDRSQSPKPYRREKVADLEPPKLTPCRLIPELSARHKIEDQTSAWSGVKKTSILKPISKLQGDPKWTVDGTEISFNGKKLLYNYSNNRTKLMNESQSFSPYKIQSQQESNKKVAEANKEEIDHGKLVTFNGKNFVYSFEKNQGTSKPKKSPKKLEPLYRGNNTRSTSPKGHLQPATDRSSLQSRPLSPKGHGIGALSPKGPAILPVTPKGSVIRPAEQSPKIGSVIAGHGQSGGIVKVAPGQSPSPLGINLPFNSGQRIIKIVTPSGQLPTSAGSKIINLGSATSNKAIRVQGGMLILEGQPTGIQIPGKARIIYQGNVTQVSSGSTTTTTDSDKPVYANSNKQTTDMNSTDSGGSVSSTVVQNNFENVSSPKQTDNIPRLTPVSVNKHSGEGDSIQMSTPGPSPVNSTQSPALMSGNIPNLPVLQSGDSTDINTTSDKNLTPSKQLPSGKSLPRNSVIESKNKSEDHVSKSSTPPALLGPPVLEPETTYIGLSKTPHCDNSIPELSPMKPPSQLPKKRKIVDSSNSSSPPKVFIEGLSNSPARLSSNLPKHSDAKNVHESWKTSPTKKSSEFPPFISQKKSPHKTVLEPVIKADVKYSVGDSGSKLTASSNIFSSLDSMADSRLSPPNVSELSSQKETSEKSVSGVPRASDNISATIGQTDKFCNRAFSMDTNDTTGVNIEATVDSELRKGLHSPTRDSIGSESPKKSSPDKGNLFDNFASFLHTDSGLGSSQKKSLSGSECTLTNSFVNSLSSGGDNESSNCSVNSQNHSSVNLSSSSQTSKPRLPQSMMEKVSTFAANLHTGSLASRLGNFSPPKMTTESQPQQQRFPQYDLMQHYSQMVVPPGGYYYPQYEPVTVTMPTYLGIYTGAAPSGNSDMPFSDANTEEQQRDNS